MFAETHSGQPGCPEKDRIPPRRRAGGKSMLSGLDPLRYTVRLMSSIAHILSYAVEVQASDVHLVAGQRPIFRQYGELVDGGEEVLTAPQLAAIVEEMLPDHLRDTFRAEKEVDFSIQEPGVGRFRANAFLEKGLPSLALRKVNETIPSFAELHLPAVLGDIALSSSGIVLASGSTGSGKSTTLARMIQHINEHAGKRIITIEDPIEYLFTNQRSVILQREIGTDTRDFLGALRSILRQDPDVVMVGEMRDAESFAAALTMAETGHLVLSTLHTDTASQAISRILNYFTSHERDTVRMSLAVNLRAVFCQRLLQDVEGRSIPAVEIMINTPFVRKLIESNALEKLPSAIETGREDGMQTFNQHIYELIREGRITEHMGRAYATNPAALDMMLSGINLRADRRIVD